jgi:ribose transport system ATP-binding protein
MAEIDELADRVSVLRDGRHVGTLARQELSPGALIRLMVGRDLSSFYKKEHKATDSARDVLLSVRDIADDRRVHGCSFDLHAGEVLGIAGLVGAGRTELARLICGIDRRTHGTVRLAGEELAAHTPAETIAAGIVYLTEDRKALGLYLDMSVRENVNIDVIARDARWGGLLNLASARQRAAASMRRLSVRASSDGVNVGSLSGGNQQKVLLGRLLETRPRVMLLDEPTRGVDIGAKSEIYRLIDDLARAGIGIVVISSELPEILGICDRILVMRDGRFAGNLLNRADAPVTQEAVMALATGASRVAA